MLFLKWSLGFAKDDDRCGAQSLMAGCTNGTTEWLRRTVQHFQPHQSAALAQLYQRSTISIDEAVAQMRDRIIDCPNG
jgi:hypothetical protein